MKKTKNLLLLITFIISLLGTNAAPVLAATAPKAPVTNPANNGQALEIAPPVIYLNADPGQTIKTQIFISLPRTI